MIYLFTFTNDDGEIIAQIRAETGDQALVIADLPYGTTGYQEETTQHIYEINGKPV